MCVSGWGSRKTHITHAYIQLTRLQTSGCQSASWPSFGFPPIRPAREKTHLVGRLAPKVLVCVDGGAMCVLLLLPGGCTSVEDAPCGPPSRAQCWCVLKGSHVRSDPLCTSVASLPLLVCLPGFMCVCVSVCVCVCFSVSAEMSCQTRQHWQ